MSVLHFILLYMCMCSYPHIHIHSHIHKHAQRAEAEYSVVRKSLKSLIKVCVTALNEKSGPFPFILHIETTKEMSLIVFMLKDSTFPFDIVFYLSSSFIIWQKSILNIVWKSDFWGSPLLLDFIFVCAMYCTKLSIDMKQAAERFFSFDDENESIFNKPSYGSSGWWCVSNNFIEGLHLICCC